MYPLGNNLPKFSLPEGINRQFLDKGRLKLQFLGIVLVSTANYYVYIAWAPGRIEIMAVASTRAGISTPGRSSF